MGSNVKAEHVRLICFLTSKYWNISVVKRKTFEEIPLAANYLIKPATVKV